MADSNTAGTQAAPGAAAASANAGAPAAGAAGTQVPITALHEEREKRQALADEVAALKTQLQTLATRPAQQAAPAQQPSVDQQAQLDAMWRSDPRAAMRHELGAALEWADKVNQEIEEQADAMTGKKEYPDFAQYRAEIMRHVRRLPLAQRATPGVIETAYFLAKGRQSDVTAAQRAAEAVAKVKAGEAAGTGAPAGGNAGGAQRTGGGDLTDQQKAAAAAMGIPEADYLKHMRT